MSMQEIALMTREVLTLDQIEKWARAKAPTQSVGVTNDVCGCPVAEYLLATVPQPVDGSAVYWEVGENLVLVRTVNGSIPEGRTLDMPPQISEVVEQIDNLTERGGHHLVHAQQLLRVIAGVRGVDGS